MHLRSAGTQFGAAALLLLLLGGCGFHPLYAEQSTLGYDPALAAIAVQPVPDRLGQILTTSLREQLNPRGVALPQRYLLQVTMQTTRGDLGIRRDASASRSNLNLRAHYALFRAGSTAAIYNDSVNFITSFNIPDDAYAATVTEQNAREQAARDLGEEIALRLALFLRQQGE